MQQSGVYAIVDGLTGRRYIGSSVDVVRRWREHLSRLRRGVHRNRALQQAWQCDGQAEFSFVFLETADDAAYRIAREQYHLNQSIDPFNASPKAGSGPRPGYRHRPESIEKMQAAQRGKPKTLEHRAKLSAAKRGRPCPAQSVALKGRSLSEETRARMSATRRGKPWSAARRAAEESRQMQAE